MKFAVTIWKDAASKSSRWQWEVSEVAPFDGWSGRRRVQYGSASSYNAASKCAAEVLQSLEVKK